MDSVVETCPHLGCAFGVGWSPNERGRIVHLGDGAHEVYDAEEDVVLDVSITVVRADSDQ